MFQRIIAFLMFGLMFIAFGYIGQFVTGHVLAAEGGFLCR
jgi:hypothetical protein